MEHNGHPPANGNGAHPHDGDDDGEDSLFDDVERRAFFDLPDEDDDEPVPDLVASLHDHDHDHDHEHGHDHAGTAGNGGDARDMTLGGYIEKHSRVPAFDGADGQPYTVDVDVEEDGAEPGAPWAAFLVFIRWAATGAGIMDHVESGDVARGATEEDARRGALDLSLYEIKAELDAAIERRRTALED
jgi:hypothetical protein